MRYLRSHTHTHTTEIVLLVLLRIRGGFGSAALLGAVEHVESWTGITDMWSVVINSCGVEWV